jgi:hypothetical protein
VCSGKLKLKRASATILLLAYKIDPEDLIRVCLWGNYCMDDGIERYVLIRQRLPDAFTDQLDQLGKALVSGYI